jgi:hypothetical protein
MRISDVLALSSMRAPEVTAPEFEGQRWTYREPS